ncbi:hypothetical protein HPB52_025375 [Rhipicephalus sanguineus]|uniref:Sulfotransferase domain-containing protein n=1 Tax=Rhipicephalus sanguineus TaxID=34632 RepID=A0A9D4YS26_RHISA|nr:hypothetical protein HPB52_025375 [Rhipicephalus sanguineus]
MDEESYRYVEGVWLHDIFKAEQFRSAINYKPRDGDIFVASYPKCGTNWTHFIVYNILFRAKPVVHLAEFRRTCPFIDANGSGVAEDPLRTGPIMTHFPSRVLRRASCAKYIYITRNPYDCATSYYHFLKGITPKTTTDVSFERFLSLFLAGKLVYGDYFDHLLPWYERRGDDNVLFLTYEQMKADTRGQVLKIADFLGKNEHDDEVEMHQSPGFIRKGVVGDWRNHFTSEQARRTKEWITRKTEGSDVMTLWKDCGLP